jgi:hypothetical protein
LRKPVLKRSVVAVDQRLLGDNRGCCILRDFSCQIGCAATDGRRQALPLKKLLENRRVAPPER